LTTESSGLVGTSCGPYRIVRELGSGAMGTVYLAEVEDDEPRQVALKLLHPHLLRRRGYFTRFRREAEVGRQVEHQNVIRTLECDLLMVDGELRYFLVMEYVAGQTLRELFNELGTIPEGLLREIAVQTCAGLAAIHAEGIVHRDLKPENILIAQDQRVRIMDLGVAKHEDTSMAITLQGKFAGSLLYVAPEQIRQETVGPAADLYALGVMLHEFATGNNAFRGDSAAAIMYAHLNLDPEPPEALSPFMQAVIETLLAKTPSERFLSATALQRTLQDGEESQWWSERSEDTGRRPIPGVHIPVRRSTKLYGRENELRILREAWEGAKQGRGSTLCIEGEGGIGKTRLMDAFVRSVAGEGATVLYGSYSPSGGDDALAESLLDRFGRAFVEDELQWYLSDTPELVPAVHARLKHQPAPEGSAPLDGGAEHAVWCSLVRALAKERPLVWVVEDMQFTRPEAWQTVLSMARAAANQRVLMLISTRPPMTPEDTLLFERLPRFRRVPLRRLRTREVVRLLNDAFRSRELAVRLGGRIAEKSDGVPFFVVEMIRGLGERQFLSELPDGSFVEARVIDHIAVPSAVRDLVEARLSQLTPDERAVLDVGAVQGFEFDPLLIARVLKLENVTALQRIAHLERRFGVVHDQELACRFDHHLIQEVLYSSLMPSLRAEYHTLLADALASEAEPGPQEAHRIATHYLNGNSPSRAFPFMQAALTYLSREGRNEARVALADAALAARAGLDGEGRVGVLLDKARALGVLGRTVEQEEVLASTLAFAKGLDDRPLLLRVMGEHTDTAIIEEARVLARELGDKRAEGRALVAIGGAMLARGEVEQSHGFLQQGLDIADGIDDDEGRAIAFTNLSSCHAQMARLEEGREDALRAVELLKRLGRRTRAVLGSLRLASAHRSLGDVHAAREAAEGALVAATSAGYRDGEAMAGVVLGTILTDLGRWSEASERFGLAVARAQETSNRSVESRALRGWGEMWEIEGRGDRALQSFDRALELQPEIRDPAALHLLRAGRAHLLALHGCTDGTQATLQEACDDMQARGAHAHAARIEFMAGEASEAAGRVEEALQHYADTIAHLRASKDLRSLSETLFANGRLLAAQGRADEARADLIEAHDLADELHLFPQAALVAAHLAPLQALSHDELASVAREFEVHEDRMQHRGRMSGRLALWEATSEDGHRIEALRLLQLTRDCAPKSHKATVDAVPLHARVIEAAG